MEDYRYYFHTPSQFKINNEVAWNYRGKWIKAIVLSEQYIAPSGVPHTNIKYKNTIYAVPTFDLRSPSEVKFINEAFVLCSNRHRGPDYSRSANYILEFDGEEINKTRYPCFRKEANIILLDNNILNKYNIHKVYSRGILIYNKD